MAGRGRLAFANARVRALKSRLFGRDLVTRLTAGPRARSLPGGEAATIEALAAGRFAELIEWYGVVLASYPAGQALLLALLRLHEIENLKLAWRALTRRHAPSHWAAGWLALGPLATISFDAAREAESVAALAAAVRRSPFASIASAMVRAHPADLVAVEIGFDRWASRAVVDAAVALGPRERGARDLALAVVRERDLHVVRRTTAGHGLPPDAVSSALALWPRELGAADVARIAAWHPADGPLWAVLPRAFKARQTRPHDWDDLEHQWRRDRRLQCRRAFIDQPFCLAPGVAVLLLKEEEVRGLEAMAETGGIDTPVLERVLAAGPLGA